MRASREWVMVKLNAEKGARNVALTQKFKVDGFPFLLMLDGQGKVLNQTAGYMPAPALISEMKKAQANNGVLSAFNSAPRPWG